jgi:hypothetical protein
MKARHLAGSMCRFAVQRVLARPFWNISALARASAAATSVYVPASRYGASGPGHMRWISMSAAHWSAKYATRSLSC